MRARRAVRIASAYLDARLAGARIRDRAALERRQARLWQALQPALEATPALASLVGRPFEAFPVREPSEVRQDLDAWNSLGLRTADIRAAAEAAEAGSVDRDGNIQAGFSTGSAGERGVFLTCSEERDRYIGVLLGRLIAPAKVMRPIRAALILRANNSLYDAVRGAGAAFAFVGLEQSPEAHRRALATFRPTHLVAPAHALAAMARLDGFNPPPTLEAVFCGAEPMGEREAHDLTRAWRIPPRPLYQATEGFLAAPCPRGGLHLNEHDMIVELDPVAGDGGRFRPVVTDLRRRSQPIVRVRLDDLIVPAPACPCGSPCRAILPVEGRVQDVWRFDGSRPLFPRDLTDALEAALPPLAPWRVHASPQAVSLDVEDPAEIAPGLTALRSLLAERGVAVPISAQAVGRIEPWPKRRRVSWQA